MSAVVEVMTDNSGENRKGGDNNLLVELLPSNSPLHPVHYGDFNGPFQTPVTSPTQAVGDKQYSSWELEDTKDCFQNVLASQSTAAYLLLCCCGLVWKDWVGISNCLHNIIMATLCLLGALPVVLYLIYIDLPLDHQTGASILIVAALGLQSVGLAIGTYFNACRLRSKCRKYEVRNMCLTISVTIKTIMWAAVCSLLPALPIFLKFYSSLVALAVSAVIVLLGGNLQFLLADALSAQQILLKLTGAVVKNEEITLLEVQTARKEIDRIVDNDNAANTAIMATALINVLSIFVISILLNDSIPELIETSCFLLFKEVVVALVGLYWIACVNDESQRLVQLVSDSLTTRRLLNDLEASQVTDLTIILQSLHANRIQFSITGMVISRKEVAFRFGAWLFGTVLSSVSKLSNR
jgi:hypothetical protein